MVLVECITRIGRYWCRKASYEHHRFNRVPSPGRWEGDGRGDRGDLAHLLRTAEILHVGKGATFGLGKIEIA